MTLFECRSIFTLDGVFKIEGARSSRNDDGDRNRSELHDRLSEELSGFWISRLPEAK